MNGPFVLRCDGCGCFMGEHGERIEPPPDAKVFQYSVYGVNTGPPQVAFRLPAEGAPLFSGTREEIEPFARDAGWSIINQDEFFCPQCISERIAA